MNYDPNLINKFPTQRVHLTLGMWEYRAEFWLNVGGNCRGMSVIDSAIDNLLEELYDYNKHMHSVILYSEEGTLICDDDDCGIEEWLRDMIISAEIIDIQPNK